RRSIASNTASGSTRPPPDPVMATVAPFRTSAAASAAVITLCMACAPGSLQLQLADDVAVEPELAIEFGLELVAVLVDQPEVLAREEFLVALLLGHFLNQRLQARNDGGRRSLGSGERAPRAQLQVDPAFPEGGHVGKVLEP